MEDQQKLRATNPQRHSLPPVTFLRAARQPNALASICHHYMSCSTERVPHCIDEWAALVTLRRSSSLSQI